jgi:hypothetical protein
MNDLFQGLPQPKTATQEVLLTLILQGNVSIFDFAWMSGFRTRISNLKLDFGLKLETIKLNSKNKYGNAYTYCKHSLPAEEKQGAIDLYLELWANTK